MDFLDVGTNLLQIQRLFYPYIICIIIHLKYPQKDKSPIIDHQEGHGLSDPAIP
jgi:hypothetical protein